MLWFIFRKARNGVAPYGYIASQLVNVVYGLLRNGLYPLLITCSHYLMKFMFKNHKLLKQDREKRLMLLESSSNNRWQYSLSQDIMELILRRLCANDYLRVGTVCTSWCTSVAKVIAEKRCVPRPLPLLITFHSKQNLKTSDHTFFSLSDDGLYCTSQSRHPNLYRRHICGTIEGWMIIADGAEWRPKNFLFSLDLKVHNYFYNPILRAKVSLPSQMTLPCYCSDRMFFFRKVVASSVPNNNNNKCCNSTLVFAISIFGDLVFCRQGCDDIWTILYKNEDNILYNYLLPPEGYVDIAIHGGKLYALTCNVNFVFVIDLPPPSDSGHHDHQELRMQTLIVHAPQPECHDFIHRQGNVIKGYNQPIYNLVVDFYMGKVLLVMQLNDYVCYENDYYSRFEQLNYISAPKARGFRVFELEESNGNDWVAWREIDDLGDRIVFVSAVSSSCVNGSKDELTMRQGNRIYFAWDFNCMDTPTSSGRNVGMFSLADGSIKPIIPTTPRCRIYRFPLWFTPIPW